MSIAQKKHLNWRYCYLFHTDFSMSDVYQPFSDLALDVDRRLTIVSDKLQNAVDGLTDRLLVLKQAITAADDYNAAMTAVGSAESKIDTTDVASKIMSNTVASVDEACNAMVSAANDIKAKCRKFKPETAHPPIKYTYEWSVGLAYDLLFAWNGVRYRSETTNNTMLVVDDGFQDIVMYMNGGGTCRMMKIKYDNDTGKPIEMRTFTYPDGLGAKPSLVHVITKFD